MGKIRVHELAKELGIESKNMISWLKNHGIEVKNHMSTIEDDVAEMLRAKAKGQKEKKEEKSVPKQQTAKKQQTETTTQQQQPKQQQHRPQGQQHRHNRPGNRPVPQGERRDRQREQNRDRKPGQAPAAAANQPQFRKDDQRRPRPQAAASIPPVVPPEKEQPREKVKPLEKEEKNIIELRREREEQKLLEKQKTRGKAKKGNKQQRASNENQEVIGPIIMGASISVQELANRLKKPAAELIKKLIGLGIMATINQEIDAEVAEIICADYGVEVQVKIEDPEKEILELLEQEDSPEDLVARPCVVTVMGHVDHGKTSLLDAIRQTNVTASEAGGITQHIGAYQVEHNGQKITFLDTPGHEAFTAMRARGAKVTDIAILVVAADDGVMPQTVEAINHAKAANVPIIVAINKMDKPGANPDRVKQELTEHGLLPEEWGGDTICVNVSAKTKQGISDLLEMILLVAEMLELKANPKRLAKGTVIEAKLDKGRGPVATVLVQNGTLQIGDAIVAGTAFGRVRAMTDDKGRQVKKAPPSMPVEVLGLSEVPEAGDVFYAFDDEKKAKQLVQIRLDRKREEELKANSKVSLEDLFARIKEGEIKELNVIVKADVQGSVEALKQSLENLSNDEVRVKPIHGGVGAITETDIMLASASNAIIIGFNVRPDSNARKAAEKEKIDIRLYRVIYDAIEDVKAAMSGLLEPEIKEVVLGRAEVRQTFKASKIGTIAGCYVLEGKITRDSHLRLIRNGIVVHEGKLESLKRFKDDVREVNQGYECGLTIEKYNDIKEGDILEFFTFEKIKREI
ncbi:bacterial translation initiation factor 2 (bIF-2) [Carboxydocella sporoproducens DSM 16521]|uniref:Translation initiation factor IF-2 n=2 Tax=Carboxydocella TaxID=178898 RepID=A0A1T4P6E1_9FIRM|nr:MULTISPECIES: translation initiation factor IF-2 [Carboxydocella]AVX20720.1 bacterial translation initiation factor 2 (bIF-2) [Carboxydocella thermautotrophica]SJZ87103.1 bacterial translation initiation factor 2 (bIF-2) [Carboxydocella sporoproducens DSM 16521]